MKALLLKAPRQLELAEMARPELLDCQVRVRVARVGVCGSDYASIAGKLPFTRFPIVPGHEASGEVLEAGKQTEWRPGDRVLLHPILVNRSEAAFAQGEVHHSDSTEVLGVVSRNGAYAEETVVEDYMLRKIPHGMDYETAAMVEPVAVAVRALERGGIQPGDRVLVFGAGNIGLLLIQVARALGASRVVVTDILPERLTLAAKLGVDHALDVRAGFPGNEFEKQFEIVIDGVGSEESVQDALVACARGSRIVVYGVPKGDITFALKVAFSKDIVLATSRLYDADFDLAIRLMAEGKIRAKDIITHRIALGDAPALFNRILDGEERAIKIMISP
jgi:2-desacetyl-2-hydroxyethyl bacteriochlorophyllide A dehydrogenase